MMIGQRSSEQGGESLEMLEELTMTHIGLVVVGDIQDDENDEKR